MATSVPPRGRSCGKSTRSRAGSSTTRSRSGTGRWPARAALEAIDLPVGRPAARDANAALPDLRIDGGAIANNLLMQFRADLLGCPVLRPRVQETTALGAAYHDGLATCVWPDQASIAQRWQIERRFEPRMSREDAAVRIVQ